MFLSPATDPSAASLRQLPHTVYADMCTDIVTFGLLQQYVRLQLTDYMGYTSPPAAFAACKMLPGSSVSFLWCFSPDACTTSLEAAALAASVEQNTVQTVYVNVLNQSR